ncbi:hypothetical protein H311_04376 [Anncaliia algerae PRA109]|nr:hypothetical protein H311_04376 [Anncaliia algerae PRA109]
MMNIECKCHQRRSLHNQTEATSIVKIENNSTRAFVRVMENKKSEILISIICENVINGSIIYTDKYKGYFKLGKFVLLHKSVFHKYNFVNPINGVHIQHVESFHNEMKLEIKRRKGIKTEERQEFLNEFCRFFNNKDFRLEQLL